MCRRHGAKTGVQHHGELESVIYVARGKARMRWGERLEFVAEASPGDFIYVQGAEKRVWCPAQWQPRLRTDRLLRHPGQDLAQTEQPGLSGAA